MGAPRIFKYLDQIAHILPIPIYWLDLNQKYLGVNKLFLKCVGAVSYEKDFLEKTPYALYPKEMAE